MHSLHRAVNGMQISFSFATCQFLLVTADSRHSLHTRTGDDSMKQAFEEYLHNIENYPWNIPKVMLQLYVYLTAARLL